MARQFTEELTQDQHRARIYWDTEWEQFSVRYYHHAEWLGADCTSFEDTLEDAQGTARAELKAMAARQRIGAI